MKKPFFRILAVAALLGLTPTLLSNRVDADETNAPAPASASPAPSVERIDSQDVFRAYLQLQEQLRETQLSIERSGRETELATLNSAAVLSNRLQAMELTVKLQQEHELVIVRDMMLIAGAFVVIGLVALVLTSYFHWRAVSRLGEIAAALPAAQGLGVPAPKPALGLGENPLQLDHSGGRLLEAITRLEKRMGELERGEHSETTAIAGTVGFEPTQLTQEAVPEMALRQHQTKTANGPDHSEQVAMLLAKGQVLLNQDQAEPAIACFDEALQLDAAHTELLVKKGDALEKLRRSTEALECYDRALAIDNSMTIAYLHKGGLLNRLERFDEAMHCYEQALRTQDKDRAA